MSNEYDISRAFKRIENDLMDSMMRNLKRHQAEEDELGIKWEQWQALQLKELERYRKENATKFGNDFTDINNRIEDLFSQTYADAQAQEEARILDDIRKGKYRAQKKDTSFFNVNDDKMGILLERTKADFVRAEYAVLRGATDQYRSIIFDAQVYANITNDYKKAVDMATHDYLKNGLQTIQYKNGARHNISDYAEMAIRTGNKRAYLMGEGNAHDEFGIHTVRVNKRTQACPKCVGFLGKVLVDDVYAGGTPKEAMEKRVPLLSQAIAQGFLHPNCKDIYSMYIEGVSRPSEPWTQEEIDNIVGDYNQAEELKHAQDMQESYARMSKYSLDPSNQEKYQARADGWSQRVADISAGAPPQPIVPPITVQAPTPQPIAQSTQIEFADGIKQEELIKRLDNEYTNHTTKVVHGAHKAGGSADLGGAIRISNSDEATAIHEFAHQIATEYRTKVGLGREQDAEFWKELKKIHRKYLRETEGNPSLWISSYEHGTRDVSEFMAEAFTQQKLKEYGLPLPRHYGADDTYSRQVLELIDKYYKKDTVAVMAEEVAPPTKDILAYNSKTVASQYRHTAPMNEYEYWGNYSTVEQRFDDIKSASGFDDEKARKVLDAFCGNADEWVGDYDSTPQGWFYRADDRIRDWGNTEWEKQAKLIDEYIVASPKYKGEIWRGMALDQDVIDSFEVGGTFTETGRLSSWTSDKDIAQMFAEGRSEELNKMPVMIKTVDPEYGVPVAHLSVFGSDEQEVLVSNLHNKHYRIAQINQNNGVTEIILKSRG